MAFFGNDAINRVNLHYGIQALAQAGGGIFFLVFLLREGVPVPATMLAMAGILLSRLAIRPAVLPLAKRWGMKPVLIVGALTFAIQYPMLAEVHGVGRELYALCIVAAVADVLYWPTYHAYFSALGDAEHRGHQVSAREALVSIAAIVAPLLGAWGLLALGARSTFAVVGAIQALSVLPLVGAPNVAVQDTAPHAIRAARFGVYLALADGWYEGGFTIVWQIALFVSLGESLSAYGGAVAFAALVGVASGLWLGRHVDLGGGRQAVLIAIAVAITVVGLRAASFGSPWLAVAANAAGALVAALVVPVISTPSYNLAKASPCPMRFHLATEAGYDVGMSSACIVSAAMAAHGVPLSFAILLALPASLVVARLLHGYYAQIVAR